MYYGTNGEDMNTFFKWTLIGIALTTSTSASSQERDRAKIPEKYKWNLTDLYTSDEEWTKAKDVVKGQIPEISKFAGTLGTSAQQLYDCLHFVSSITKEFERLYSYASMSLDQDTRVQKYLAMQSEMSQIGSEFSARASFIEPEILRIDSARIEQFIRDEPKLGIYKHYLRDILRRKAHTGTEGEERIIAEASLMADAPETIHSIFANADFPYPQITLSDGRTVKLDHAGYSLHRASPNRDDRIKVFNAFFGKLNEFRRTYGTQLNAQIKRDLFYRNVRKYSSCLESALDANNIPTKVYTTLIENVNKHLPTFHRYLKLRQRLLGVEQLHYYDLYAPLVKEADLHYSYEEAQTIILKSLQPLGENYVAVVQRAFNERWIDVFPNEGKRSGAYSNGSAYDVHPYILMNYNGKYDDVSTLAHELGHTMHSYLSNTTQPYPLAQYPIFVAEVASTFNEALLIEYMLKTISDNTTRLSLLGSYLENIKGTVFRQTQFAEFELKIHEMVENGQPLTGDVLNQLYLDITRKYYGHDLGICIVDDIIQAEWMFIPHFYYNFYVYQYATAFTASAALSERTLAGDHQSTQKYLEFLSSGGSDYPINLLKKAGIDMTTSEPFELTMIKMNRIIDEMERILTTMKK
ncbi:MAG: oligoendopeptidase F [Bacteroidetes bacterium]|nr:oligoendopeptidase F [Bacteroidota bacterium]